MRETADIDTITDDQTTEVDQTLLAAEAHLAGQEGDPSLAKGPIVEAPRPVEGHDTVAILDFGSQYTQLIARRVRELGVYCEILPHDASQDAVSQLHPR